MNKRKRVESEPTTMYRFDKEIGFWGIPNMKEEVFFGYEDNKSITVSQNALGLREEEISESKDPTILCCGGSHTWGAGIAQDQRYSDLLKKKQAFRVVNMGHCSLGLDQIILAIIKNAEKFNTKIIFIEQYTWALHRVITKYVNGYIRPNFTLSEKGELTLNKIPAYYKFDIIRKQIGNYHNFKKELNEFLSGIDLKNKYDLKIDPVFLTWKTSYYQHMYELIHALIGLLSSFCKAKGIKLLFGITPLKNQLDFESSSELIDFDLPHKKFRSILDDYNIRYIDTTSEMKIEHKKSPVIFPDGHLNKHGHYFLSELVVKELNRLNWLNNE